MGCLILVTCLDYFINICEINRNDVIRMSDKGTHTRLYFKGNKYMDVREHIDDVKDFECSVNKINYMGCVKQELSQLPPRDR